MTEPDRRTWAYAYARQGRSDWDVYKKLADMPDIGACHSLHYLQMACEKIAKAYGWLDPDVEAYTLMHKHVAFSKFIGGFLGSPTIRSDYRGRAEQLRNVAKLCCKLAREVEKLAPAVDRQKTPENTEYPWARGDRVIAPCDYAYPSLSLLKESGGRLFLKLLGRAFTEYEDTRTP